MTHDFSDLTPPNEDVARALADFEKANHAYSQAYLLRYMAAFFARWGAEQAAERLANQWPEPITDRRPTEADGDSDGWVQYRRAHGAWNYTRWKIVADNGAPWRHSPRWQPPAPPPLTPQQQEAMDALDHILKHSTTNLGEAVIRRAILGGEA